MVIMVARSRQTQHQHKRHGHHQKRSSHFLKVYSPYIPMLVIIVIGLVFSSYWQPRSRHGVLAYATSMSVSELLADTNQQRAANGVGGLNLNIALDQAAQTKANDMVARNYWSHNTPDGNAPWVFITNAGYQYKSAGENLAYGFMTTSDTIAGWMNSPEHKANLLNGGFSEVGFGYANSPNFNSSGPETVVVAMYASPLIVETPTQQATPPTPAAATKAASTPTTTATTPPATPPSTPATPTPTTASLIPATNKPSTSQITTVKQPPTTRITRLAAFTQGSTPWIATMVSLITVTAIGALILKHTLALRRVFVKGESYVLHHMVFDVTIISLIGLCVVLSRTAGFIR